MIEINELSSILFQRGPLVNSPMNSLIELIITDELMTLLDNPVCWISLGDSITQQNNKLTALSAMSFH